MDRDELIRKYHTDPESLSPEVRERTDAASKRLKEKLERGEYSPGKPGDNFAIGLDDNYEPFPVTKKPTDD